MPIRILLVLSFVVVSCNRAPESAPKSRESLNPLVSSVFSHPGIIEFDLPDAERIDDPTTDVPKYKLSDGSTVLVYGFLSQLYFENRQDQEHLTPEEQKRNETLVMGIADYSTREEVLVNGLRGVSYMWIIKETNCLSQCKTILYNQEENYGLELQVFDADSMSVVDEFLQHLIGISITSSNPNP